MNTELVQTLTSTFESHAQQTEGGVEFWLARDIQLLLGYAKWDNFLNVVAKAKTACEVSGHQVLDHFADVGKTIPMPKGAEKEIPVDSPRRKRNPSRAPTRCRSRMPMSPNDCRTTENDFLAARSANDATPYPPGATPQVLPRANQQGLKARPMAPRWTGPSALRSNFRPFPGAMPQADMDRAFSPGRQRAGTRVWCRAPNVAERLEA